MTQIYLIRHTQAEGNLYKVMQGHWDGDVTELGLREIDALAERFKNEKIDAVYSSDLYRAFLTAKTLTRYNNLQVIRDRRLREINMGSLEGRFFGNVMHDDPDCMMKFIRSPWEWQCADSETLDQVAARALPAVRELAEKHEGQTIALVSHGVTIRCILTGLLNFPRSGPEMVPIVGNTSVTKLSYDGGTFSPEYLNDCSHLDVLQLSDWIQRNILRHEPFDPSTDPEYYMQCYREAWSFAHRGSLRGFAPETYLSSAVEHFRRDRNSVVRLYYEDRPAGLVDLDVERGAHANYGWISLLYLEPEFRHMDLGIQALGRAIMHYRKLGRTSLRLNVAASNVAAQKFYQKHRFRILSAEPGMDGPVYLMEKSLGRTADVR